MDAIRTQLPTSLIEFYPPTGAAYIAALKGAGMNDEEIAADYQNHVRNQPTKDLFIAAMEQRIEDVKQ